MFNAYYGEFSSGRLKRLPYFGYIVLLAVLFFAFMLATVATIVGFEKAIGGDLAMAQELIRNSLSIPYMIILAIFMFALFVGGLNIFAKRARDTGLPGWLFVLGFIIVSMLVAKFISPNAGHSINIIVGLLLLFIPSDTFKGNRE